MFGVGYYLPGLSLFCQYAKKTEVYRRDYATRQTINALLRDDDRFQKSTDARLVHFRNKIIIVANNVISDF
ncbi:hypothetical protein ACH3XW_35335 [Acanthocheilonema viteae]